MSDKLTGIKGFGDGDPKPEMTQHERTKRNNNLMISMDRKREKNRVANEAKSKALSERTKDKRALVTAGKRIVGDKTLPYWKKKQQN